MTDIGKAFIEESCRLMVVDYLPRIERAIERLSDEEIWWRPNEESNAIGNLMLHLAGNVRQWIVSGIGGAADERERQQEFNARGPVVRDQLLIRLKDAVSAANEVLTELASPRLLERRTIQGHDVTVFDAIYHVVEHFSMHTGQIIYVSKMRRGDLGFYDLSDGTPRPQWRAEGKR